MTNILLILTFIVVICSDKISSRELKYANPDEYGYRYCGSWKLADGTFIYSTCDPFSFKRCGKPLEFGYECCAGFKKIGNPIFEKNEFGKEVCAQTIPQWKSCPDILNSFNELVPFSQMISSGEMMNENPVQDFTIFAPQSKDRNEISKIYSLTDKTTNNPVFYHIVKGRFYASNLRNNQELESYYQNQKLKVTKYSFGVICIDCVELTKADFECKNGIIHFIRKPLISHTGTSYNRNNLLEALKSDPEISSFANDIPVDIQNEFKNVRSKTWYTVLPVKNENWNKLKNKYSPNDLSVIVRNHIFYKLYCSAGLYKDKRPLRSLSGEYINIECSTEDSTEVRFASDLYGIKSRFISLDNMARNGVYHTLDKPIIPLAARSVQDILKDPQNGTSDYFKANKYFNYIKDCDLKMEPGKKYSIILPTDVSFEWWKTYNQFKPEYNRFINDKEYRCRVARYHIIQYNPELQKIGSLLHEQKGYKSNNIDLLHEVGYFMKDKDRSDIYFHYSPVIDFKSIKFRDGSIYPTSKINVIPEKFIVDILKEHPKLKITSDQVQKSDMDLTEFKKRRPLSLFLATLDEGLKDSKNQTIEVIHGNSSKNYLLLHTVPLYLWGGDIGYFKKNTVQKFMSRLGLELIFWMDNNQTMRIGYEGLPKEQWAEVVKFNLHAKDGIVWLLKRSLPCPEKFCPHKMIIIDADLFDVYVSACQIMELPGISGAKDAKAQFNSKPIQIALDNPDKCSIYKQPTYKVVKKLDE